MNWLQRYRLRRVLGTTFWAMPVAAMFAALLVAPLFRWLDAVTGWAWFDFTPDGARAILGALSASMLTFIIFVLSAILVVVQLASAQMTPRVIALAFANQRLKTALGLFAFSYTYTLSALGRVEDSVPQLPVAVAVLCNLACIVVFFRFVHEVGTSLRPINVLLKVLDQGRVVVESVYPNPFDPTAESPPRRRLPEPSRTIHHTGLSGVVLAFSPRDVVELARQADAVVELVPQVGDFIARGDPLFRVGLERRPVPDEALRNCVALGPERTMEQDPRFTFRIIVDIANKALSPAINDPTTAVLALDQIHRLLLYVGRRRLDEEETHDAQGTIRLIHGTPDWPDYVSLGVSEFRHYGAGSIQVVRRLRAMLMHLILVLPEARRGPLRQELSLLERSVERTFPDAEDRASAGIGDFQGMGGSRAPESTP